MSESSSYGQENQSVSDVGTTTQQPASNAPLQQMSTPFIRLGHLVDRAIPNIRTVDGMAYALAKRTPRTVAVCMILLVAGIIASRLNIWTEGYLWGIPSLGAISMGVGFWVWSSNLMLRPDLSPEARTVLKRAINLQLSMVVAGALAVVYFIGMAMGFW